MEREIKFRGQRVDNGEWVYGSLIVYIISKDDKERWYTIKLQDAFDTSLFRVIPETVGQFVGLKDKNGVEIYEGDIISFTWFSYGEYELEHEYKGTVEFLNGSYMFCCEHGNYPFSELDFDSESDIEIISNIQDNPELINEL